MCESLEGLEIAAKEREGLANRRRRFQNGKQEMDGAYPLPPCCDEKSAELHEKNGDKWCLSVARVWKLLKRRGSECRAAVQDGAKEVSGREERSAEGRSGEFTGNVSTAGVTMSSINSKDIHSNGKSSVSSRKEMRFGGQ